MKEMYSERINRQGYIEIKIPKKNPHTGAPSRFMAKHVWLWETAHGKCPKGHCVVFLDGDRINCKLSNLSLLSRKATAMLNPRFRGNMTKSSSALTEADNLLGGLIKAIKQAKRRV